MKSRCLRVLPQASHTPSVAVQTSSRPGITRLYATQSGLGGGPQKTKRKNVTVLSDDGQYSWGELSGREKIARGTQQTFNFVVVIAGVVLTV